MPFSVNRPEYQKACQGWSDHQKTQQGSLQSQMPQVPGSSPQGQTYGPRKEEGYCQCPYARKGEIFSLICIPIIWRCLLQQTTISLFLSWIFYVQTCFHMRIPKSCLSVPWEITLASSICLTLVINTLMESSSWLLRHRNPRIWFPLQNGLNYMLFTCYYSKIFFKLTPGAFQ